MKTQKLLFGLSTIALVGSLALTSCKKKTTETPSPDTEQSTATDNSTAEGISNDMVNIGSQASENGGTSLTTFKMDGSTSNEMISSASVTITYSLSTKSFTVDFGTTPQMCSDGKMRSGKLFYDFSASAPGAVAYRMPGFKFTVTSSNYVVDGYSVTINNKTVTNTTPSGFNPATTNLSWTINSSLTIVKPSNGGTISWNGSRVKTLLNTSDPNCYPPSGTTPIHWLQAKIQLSGNSNGTNAKGETFTAVSNNLVRDFGGCSLGGKYPFISGTIDYTPGSRPTRHIDYGSGTCDNSGTITINGVTYTFTF